MIITAAEIKVGMKVTSVNNGNSCKVSKLDKTSSGIGIYKKSKGVDVLVRGVGSSCRSISYAGFLEIGGLIVSSK